MGKKAASGLEAHVGYWLRLVSNHVSYAFAAKVERWGVTVAEWVILRRLLDAGEAVNPSAVADGLGMTRGAVSKLVERLVGKGLVERGAGGADRRYQRIALTAAGRTLVPGLAALADRNDEEFFGHLSAGERARLVETLKDVVRRRGLTGVPVE